MRAQGIPSKSSQSILISLSFAKLHVTFERACSRCYYWMFAREQYRFCLLLFIVFLWISFPEYTYLGGLTWLKTLFTVVLLGFRSLLHFWMAKDIVRLLRVIGHVYSFKNSRPCYLSLIAFAISRYWYKSRSNIWSSNSCFLYPLISKDDTVSSKVVVISLSGCWWDNSSICICLTPRDNFWSNAISFTFWIPQIADKNSIGTILWTESERQFQVSLWMVLWPQRGN